MKDQIIISKENGNCAVAVPLFRLVEDDAVDRINQYIVVFNMSKPIAYAVDVGEQVTLMNAEFLQDKVEWVGDL